MQVTTDMIVGFGLVLALLMSILWGDTEVQRNLASGLIGYLGRSYVISRKEGDGH